MRKEELKGKTTGLVIIVVVVMAIINAFALSEAQSEQDQKTEQSTHRDAGSIKKFCIGYLNRSPLAYSVSTVELDSESQPSLKAPGMPEDPPPKVFELYAAIPQEIGSCMDGCIN